MNLQYSDFEIVGNNCTQQNQYKDTPKKSLIKNLKSKPYISIAILSIIFTLCLFSSFIMTHEPTYMDLANQYVAPNSTYYFGTDSMGRDIFSMVWYGGKLSLFIGMISTVISTFIGILYGSISGYSNKHIDNIMLRIIDIMVSIPSILIVIFIQAIIGKSTPITISIAIGVTSWMSIAKVVRSEVKVIRNSEYILASKTMGANFKHILVKHMLPNFIPAIMFMIVTNIVVAIGTESTLSFLGIGLPIEIISWGSMLSLAQDALLRNKWWVIVIPGLFVVTTLVCITNIGNYIRKNNNKKSLN